MPMPTSPPGAARRVPERAARLLHRPRRRAVGAGRRAAVRRGIPLVAAPQLGAGPPTGLSQRRCRVGPRPHRRRAAARPARQLPAARRPAGVRGGGDHLAALRRRVLARARLRLPSLAALGRPAEHRRLGLPGDRPAQLRPRQLDRPGRRGPAAPVGGHRPAGRRASPRGAWAMARRRAGAGVRVRRRRRLGPAHLGLADAPAAVLVRLRSDRCCSADPPPAARSPRAVGRAAMAPSSPSPTRRPGRPRPPPTSSSMPRTAP
jgi:hypothetical protein